MNTSEMESDKMERAEVLPVLPLKNTVLLPFTTMPLLAGRPASVAAVEAALATESKELAVVTQRDATNDTPTAEDFYAFGAKAVIRKMARGSDEQLTITDEALRSVISRYTREAGLRQLERAIGRLTRKIALRFAEGKTEAVIIAPEDLAEMLGPEKFFPEQARKQLPPGVATGLAWTEAGGDVLYVEATLLPEGKSLIITGQLGEVMQESAKAAQSYIWSHADELGIDRSLFIGSGVHIHVPAGAIPKDGPSAGVTMATALVSLYTKTPARSDTAMTGEITLTGLVLPIGGVKEKVLAARRAGLRRVILPKENEKDLRELPKNVHAEMKFIFAERVEQALIAAIPELAGRLTVAQAATLI